MAQTSPLSQGSNPALSQTQEPIFVQLDPKCLHSALKEFFEPLRTNDPRTDFFAAYRKESDEFDRDYAGKYDGDLNTSLIFAGLFSAVSSAFIVNVQSKLEPDPNEMTAAYMRILIHAVNSSLYTDVDPDSTTWTGPPPGIVTIQSLLYASLATSLLAAFLAMLGKQWVSWYLRNRGGSAADKSRDRQQKLDGLENWYFHIVIESLPVMLQLALLLLGCALSPYLWTISRTVAGVAITATLLGVISYICFTLAATFFRDCPYQTPASLIFRSLVPHHRPAHTPPPIPLVPVSKHPVKDIRRLFRRLHSGAWSLLSGLGCAASVPPGTPEIPLTVTPPPVRIFEDTFLDWESYQADTRCVAWLLYFTTDSDMIFSTVRFAADFIWYPEIAGALSPHILTDLFFECQLDRRVVPGRAERGSLIGMTLASILSIQLCVEPRNDDLNQLRQRIVHNVDLSSSSEATFKLVASVLDFVSQTPFQIADGGSLGTGINRNPPPKHFPVTLKLWLGRTILQTVWRWRRIQHHTTTIDFYWIAATCKKLVAEGDRVPTVFKTTWILTLTICLGATVDIRDLFPPNNDYALFTALDCLQKQLSTIIKSGNVRSSFISSTFSTLNDLDTPRIASFREACVSWIDEVVNSSYPEDERFSMASSAVALLGKQFGPQFPEHYSRVLATGIRPLLDFLLLSGRQHSAESPTYPGVVALQFLLDATPHRSFDPTILPILTSTLLSDHPLQSRTLALQLFQRPGLEWCSSQAEGFSDTDRARLLEAVGDPFRFAPDLPPQDGQPATTTYYEPMLTAILLIKFAASALWRDHLHHSNFASCEDIISTEEGKNLAIKHMDQEEVGSWTGLPSAIGCLEKLGCRNTAEVVTLWARTKGIDIVNAANHGTGAYQAEGTPTR